MRFNDNDYGGFVLGNPYEGDGVYNPFTNNSGVGGGGGTSSPITFTDVPGPRGGGIIASPDVVVDPGGGGVVFIPPVKDDAPVFVPPTYSDIDLGSLNIHLIAEETAQFLNGDTTIGYGLTTKESYQPALKFGSSKTYKANVEGKISKNYYELAIVKSNPPKDSLLGGPGDLAFDDNLVKPIRDVIRGVDLFDGVGTRKIDSPITNLKFNFGGNGFEDTIKTPTRLDSLYKEHIQITEYAYDPISQTYNWFASRTAEKNGTIALNFSFIKKEKPIDDLPDVPPYPPIDDNPLGVLVPYNIIFVSNKTSQLGDFIKLNYQFVSNRGDILAGGDDVLLSDGNIDEKVVEELYLSRGTVNFNITESYETARLILNQQNLPEGFGYTAFFYAPKAVYDRTWKELNRADVTPEDFANRGWSYVNKSFKVSGAEFLSNIAVAIVFEEKNGIEITKRKPVIELTDSPKEFEVKESDSDKIVTIPFTTANTEFVDFYISESPIRITKNRFIELSFVKDFGGEYGSKIVYFVPYNEFGRGDTVSTVIKFTSVNDFPSIIDITLPESVDVPSFSDLNIDFEVSYNTFAATSVDVFIVDGGNDIPLASAQPPKGAFTVNLRTILTQFLNGKQTDLTFKFVPYNRGGVRELVGNPYELTTKVIYPSLFLTEADIKNSIFQSISENLKFNDLGPDSKYLTHLVNFGNNEQILISSWEEDDWTLSEKVEDELGNLVVKNKVDTLLLKLYTPLTANITTNSTLWVTKLMSNPLVETVILNEQDNLSCPPIKGPNFSIDYELSTGFSTNLESLDTILLSGSVTSSTNLISAYLSSSKINTDELNIEYYSGSNYLTGSIVWDNFVHFSSAKERVDNFVYKIQLIEVYETQIQNALNVSSPSFGSVSNTNEIERQTTKKNEIINGFDGFEKFLYTSSSLYTTNTGASITWPYDVNGNRISSTNSIISNVNTGWYSNIITLAEEYDTENRNWVLNNIPQYIINNQENDSLLLFFSMIGHHFDNIYFHTKSIEKSRGLGYKNKNGISDKLLFDILKSFSWNAKNLASNSDLWSYMFGLNGSGEKVNTKSAKQRTNEVWRRIINNLPYLLKNKGTRKGIYALMACYGIPSSNLSILEFGGPEAAKRFDEEADGVGSTKLLMENTTYALTMNTGSQIEMEWKTTDKGEKPKTIELFLKPAYSGDWNVLSGSAGWKVQISGSADSEYGRVKYIDNGSTLISSDLLPIFNGRFFGISLSSGSYGITLNTKQVEKDRTIFEHSYSSSVSNTFGPQSDKMLLGNNYSGSIDEFRLWSTTLSSSVFFRHVLFPEMINGNHISSSTDDLYFRLDFEYPKNLAQTSSLINVDTNVYFSASLSRNDYENRPSLSASLYSENTSPLLYATASNFYSSTTYPYNFEPIERTVALEVPNIGATRYSTNKVRFESQTDLNGNDVSNGVNLSIKNRATKKAFDQSPIDSNRIGLFFSPTKELNIDIAKSFGGLNLDNYIGDPSDEYKSNYKDLQKLRKYYFQRFDGRDAYQYINLIKSYEKSLFEDIKKMLPARVKATTGLLIEPHILERSTIQQSKPTGDEYQKESIIDTREHINTLAETNQYETVVNTELSKDLIGENNQYEANIVSSSIDKVSADSYQYETPIYVNDDLISSAESYQKEVTIDAKLSNGTVLTELDVYDINTVVGQSVYESVGFGIYAENGYAIRNYFDKDGRKVKERIKVDLVTEEKERVIRKFAVTTTAGLGDPRGGYISDIQTYTETKLNIQPFSGSKVINPGTGSIVEVKPLSGYLPTHYRNTSDLTTGMRNSYYLGSKNTAATTLDGTPPVETFATNPNTLRVNKAGRDASEPILEVE